MDVVGTRIIDSGCVDEGTLIGGLFSMDTDIRAPAVFETKVADLGKGIVEGGRHLCIQCTYLSVTFG